MAVGTRASTEGTAEIPDGSVALSSRSHLARIVALMVLVGVLFGVLVARTEIILADGLRYITQARQFSEGAGLDAIRQSVDHPAYPVAIFLAGKVLGCQTPESWQAAAQGASVLAALGLILPLYLVTRELLDDRQAFVGTLLFFGVPITGHVFADALSESTFLLFWTLGLFGALRFLRTGQGTWTILTILGTVGAYLTRPEGLLLPLALVATLMVHLHWVRDRLGPRGLAVGLAIVVGVVAIAVPFSLLKGGLSSKPSVARLLGTAPRSHPLAVERQRPLDPNQSEVETIVQGVRAVGRAVVGATTLPILALTVIGLLSAGLVRPRDPRWTLLAIICLASLLALVRLHVTGGYCTPRHVLIVAAILVPLSAAGIAPVLRGLPEGRFRAIGFPAVVGVAILWNAKELVAPVNPGMGGYREAGLWIAKHVSEGESLVDVTGWSQFYGGKNGYTFRNLVEARADTQARWVVVREAHLAGPWWYCDDLRALVAGHRPVQVFSSTMKGRRTRILVFDRAERLAGATDAQDGLRAR